MHGNYLYTQITFYRCRSSEGNLGNIQWSISVLLFILDWREKIIFKITEGGLREPLLSLVHVHIFVFICLTVSSGQVFEIVQSLFSKYKAEMPCIWKYHIILALKSSPAL